MKHAHWTFTEATLKHVLDLAYSSEFGALARLTELDFTGKQPPEDLRYKLVVLCLLVLQNLLEREEECLR